MRGFFAPLRMTDFSGRRDSSVIRSMVVAGVMSGTSADGVDVAMCRISPARDAGETPSVKLLGHVEMAYPKAVKAAVMRAMDAQAISVAELARLNWRLGEVYADAVEKACAALGVETKAVALSRDAHLSRNKTAAKMGHPASARHGVSWADGVSPGGGGEVSGEGGAGYVADWRGGGDCGAAAGAGGE
jgi:hypothetical protein